MYDHFETYPPDPRSGFDLIDKPMWHPLYFVEFTRWKKGEAMHWRLFKKSFIISREEWNRLFMKNPEQLHQMTLTGIEGHPYQLANGTVNEFPGVIQMDTMEFLKYMVDALNAKAYQDEFVRGMIEDAITRAKQRETPIELPDKKGSEPIVGGDVTHKMVPTQTDGGGTILVNETELPDYPLGCRLDKIDLPPELEKHLKKE